MKVFNNITKIIIFPAYYLIHKNILFGFVHKFFIKEFYYKTFRFSLNVKKISLSSHSSFFFKTYEYNDRKLVENYINTKNKCIIIGGGLGFIPTLAFHKSKNKILVFEINKSIIKNLRKNLVYNNCKFNLYNNNLVLQNQNKTSEYFLGNSFLSTSQYFKKGKLEKVDNIHINKIKNFKKFNTLIIDGEGIEEYFLTNLNRIKHIQYIIFELHNHMFGSKKIKTLFFNLKKNKFTLIDKCFNSYYFKRYS
tara:strand:+ start:424 stop:1173 length:750 start_codon:yes stop_codon:yes gene_type:complete